MQQHEPEKNCQGGKKEGNGSLQPWNNAATVPMSVELFLPFYRGYILRFNISKQGSSNNFILGFKKWDDTLSELIDIYQASLKRPCSPDCRSNTCTDSG